MSEAKSYRIGNYRFVPSTGELIEYVDSSNVYSKSDSEEVNRQRLPPQPSQVLQLLVDAYPSVVSRKEIQETLWPGITANYESNLHFCIHQLRAAFREQANCPNFVETLPRRGYRLIAEMEEAPFPIRTNEQNDSQLEKQDAPTFQSRASELVDQKKPTDRDSNENVRASSGTTEVHSTELVKEVIDSRTIVFKILLVCLVVFAVLAGGLTWAIGGQPSDKTDRGSSVAKSEKQQTVRIALMPFRSTDPAFKELGNGEIATDALHLMQSHFSEFEILGPASTEQFAQGNTLRQMASELDIDVILNGRFVHGENENRLLVEVIRADNGRHVWVKYFDAQFKNSEIAKMAVEQTLKVAAEFQREQND